MNASFRWLKFLIPSGGLSAGGWRVENWLSAELGNHDHAIHTAGIHFAAYFRVIADAQRFVDAFPDLTLADGIAEEYSLRRSQRPIHETWHSVGTVPKG